MKKYGLSSAAVLVVLAGSTWTLGAFPAVIELSSLNGANGFALNGVDANDQSGRSVSAAGDVNGDGDDDIIIGARGNSYVVFGGASVGAGGAIELSSLNGTNGFVLNGSGVSVSAAGDVNGDGVDDLIIGNFFADPNGNRSGESYVVFGGASVGASGVIELSSLNGTNGFVMNGVDAGDLSGYSVSNAGDVNGDGFDDIIIGARNADPNGIGEDGESYVVFGGASVGAGGSIELSSLNGTNGFVLSGVNLRDHIGVSVSAAGDINGDGVDDVIIGAHFADSPYSFSGKSYVIFGNNGIGAGGRMNLSTLNGTNGFAVNGVFGGDLSGRSVSFAGDVNGDGMDDIIIGSKTADPNSVVNAGVNYVIFGGVDVGAAGTLRLSTLNGANGFAINGIDINDLSGFSSSSAGDINGDGVCDIIIGAHEADPNGSRSGESYVVFGGASVGADGAIELSSLNGTNGFVLNGVDTGDQSGRSVSCAGDVNGDGVDAGQQSGRSVSCAGDINGDGLDDVIIGARHANPNGNRSGASYVIFGRQFDPADLDEDGIVNALDLAMLLGGWGLCLPAPSACDVDLNGDGIVNAFDLALLLGSWCS